MKQLASYFDAQQFNQ